MSAFEDLNPGQREAVLTTEGPVLIIAGPGTGKTYTLVKRLAHLVVDMGVKPGEIMVLTFTEKAGRELATRISDELVRRGVEINLNEMYIGTFHSVCLRLLKEDPAFVQDDSVRMLDAFEQTYLVCRNIDTFRLIRGFSERIPKGRVEAVAGDLPLCEPHDGGTGGHGSHGGRSRRGHALSGKADAAV